MTTEPMMNVGRRMCRDCRAVVPPPRMYRCADCLIKRIDRIRKGQK
jgi:hypothetical protein